MIVGVVPAAGRAERLRGMIDGSKELVPAHGRPVIDHLLERLDLADEIRVVVRPAKRDLIEHLHRRATVVEGEPGTVSDSIALGLEDLADDEVVLVGFPDTLFGPPDAFERLVDALRGRHEVVLGAFTFAQPSRSDVLELGGERVARVHVRPPESSSSVVWGCFAARRSALEGIDRHEEPGQLLDELARAGKVGAVRFVEELFDLGTPEALAAVR
jgi:NDP-sugar pyrophosphorylase family protein